MPKKFVGENSKAVVAKARKAEAQNEKLAKKKQEEEDEHWKDDDKQAARKQQRKDEKDEKQRQQLQKKQELRQLADEEQAKIVSSVGKAPPVSQTKVTRAHIDTQRQTAERERLEQERLRLQEKQRLVVQEDTDVLVENVNRLAVDGVQARNVDEAISALRGSSQTTPSDGVDKHPEKRMRAAYADFEARRLPQLKAEEPSLRISQLRQMMRKEWQKHPDNPLNQQRQAALDAHLMTGAQKSDDDES